MSRPDPLAPPPWYGTASPPAGLAEPLPEPAATCVHRDSSQPFTPCGKPVAWRLIFGDESEHIHAEDVCDSHAVMMLNPDTRNECRDCGKPVRLEQRIPVGGRP